MTYLLTITETRVLRNIHLQGHMGKCGSMKAKERGELLQRMIDNGYLNSNCATLTAKGIEASAPKY